MTTRVDQDDGWACLLPSSVNMGREEEEEREGGARQSGWRPNTAKEERRANKSRQAAPLSRLGGSSRSSTKGESTPTVIPLIATGRRGRQN